MLRFSLNSFWWPFVKKPNTTIDHSNFWNHQSTSWCLRSSQPLRNISRTTRNSRQPLGGQSPHLQLRYQSASRCLVRPMYSSANLLPLYVIITATELSGGFFPRQSIKAGPRADVSRLPHSLPIVPPDKAQPSPPLVTALYDTTKNYGDFDVDGIVLSLSFSYFTKLGTRVGKRGLWNGEKGPARFVCTVCLF